MRKATKILALSLALLTVGTSMAACGGGDVPEGFTKVNYWYDYNNDETYLLLMEDLIEEFNDTVGKEKKIAVRSQAFTTDAYTSQIENNSSGKDDVYDVFTVGDRYFKKWANMGVLTSLDTYVENGSIDLSKIWTNAVERNCYDVNANISSADATLWALPYDAAATAIYFNKTILENAGVKVISVPESDLAAWNAGTKADAYGKTKTQLGITVDVPAKGYYRSVKPYTAGSAWTKPTNSEILVFNSAIAMNWDEIEDLSMLLTKSYNSSAKNTYAYYTEWWFNYGWTVGGDCVQDLTGNGDWTFTLGDWTANYKVADGQTYTGKYTDTVYQAGEAISFLDKLAVEKGQTIVADNKGGYTVNGTSLGDESYGDEYSIREDVLNAEEDGILVKLPSTKEAFTRFALLVDDKGNAKEEDFLCITPQNGYFGNSMAIGAFSVGQIAMVLEKSSYISYLLEEMKDEWGVAPNPIYKEYTNPTDPSCDEISVIGLEAGESEQVSLAIRSRSNKKDEAYVFIEWLAGETAQKMKGDAGLVPNQVALANSADYLGERPYLRAFVDSLAFETPGDWWYMQDKDWINVWSNVLNSEVRKGTKTIAQFFAEVISKANDELKDY